jgi:hypothetical protein
MHRFKQAGASPGPHAMGVAPASALHAGGSGLHRAPSSTGNSRTHAAAENIERRVSRIFPSCSCPLVIRTSRSTGDDFGANTRRRATSHAAACIQRSREAAASGKVRSEHAATPPSRGESRTGWSSPGTLCITLRGHLHSTSKCPSSAHANRSQSVGDRFTTGTTCSTTGSHMFDGIRTSRRSGGLLLSKRRSCRDV